MKTRILKPIHFNSIEELLFKLISNELSISFALCDYGLYNLSPTMLKSRINLLMWHVKKLNILSVLNKYTIKEINKSDLIKHHISKFKRDIQFRDISVRDCLNAIEFLKTQIEIRYIDDLHYDLIDAYSFINDLSKAIAIYIAKTSLDAKQLEIA